MPRTRSEILVMEVFETNSTWKELESLFCLRKDFLLKELESFFKDFSNGLDRLTLVCDKIASNQRMLDAQYER